MVISERKINWIKTNQVTKILKFLDFSMRKYGTKDINRTEQTMLSTDLKEYLEKSKHENKNF